MNPADSAPLPDQPSQPMPPTDTPAAATPPADLPAAVPTIDSGDLLRGQREVLIRHAGDTYRLRLTRNGKLILHK